MGLPILTDLQASATKGCPFCILRLTAIKQIWPGLPGNTVILVDRHHCTKVTSGISYVEQQDEQQAESLAIVWDLYLKDPDRKISFDFYGHSSFQEALRRVVPCDTGSSRSLQSARHWIKTCDEEHICMRKGGSKLPRRMVDVRNDRVRLHETTIEDRGARYACLSHCWGADSAVMLRTASSNLESHKKDIPWTRLPRTFQDAVSFTRRLDLDFLWIDSLCIVQDDAQDWQQQSADMAAIYQNGYITLAATSSRNADGGCYTREDSPRLHQAGAPLAVLKYMWSDGTEIPIFARRTFDHSQKPFPLLQRGWVS